MLNIRIIFLISCFIVFSANAQSVDDLQKKSDFRTTEEILAMAHDKNPTNCAANIFSNALIKHADEIDENAPEFKVRAWAHESMTGDSETLKELLNCPELKNIADDTTIVFSPIQYEFPGGRTLTIKYSTQPKVLKQKLILANKRSLPNGNASPDLMDNTDGSKYLNTEPAWYAIMVVQHDSLSEFVGPGKNNTLSMKYINDNIDSIYPHGYYCTSKSALANDKDTINQVVQDVVNIEDDTNDYYVAGDINLEWVMYAEIAADIIITIATMGGGEAGMVAAKGARASKTLSRLSRNVTKLRRFKNADDYAKIMFQMDNIKDYQRIVKNLEKAKKSGKDITKYEKELQEAFKRIKDVDPNMTETILKDTDKVSDALKTLQKEADDLTNVSEKLKEARKNLEAARKKADPLTVKAYDEETKKLDALYDQLVEGTEIAKIKDTKKLEQTIEQNRIIQQQIDDIEKKLFGPNGWEGTTSLGDYGKYKREVDNLESVKKYQEQIKQFSELWKYQEGLMALRRPQTGNVIVRAIKTIKAVNGGTKTMNKAGRIARAGMSTRSAKIKSFLIDATLKHGARLARFERDMGMLYGAISFLGDMYDKTSTTSKEFSNGIEFKPLCLLSADDLEGQDNVVNYGMWLMWVGNSTDEADDDAAYLQAMDFASKFYYQLDEFQDEHGTNCNVDIYVVRPIIRLDETNVENPSGELFYLFMNEIPWSTAEQFKDSVSDIKDWERTQSELYQQDPNNKYRKPIDVQPETVAE